VHETVISREDAISRLRRKLRELTGNNASVCQVAAERGILCHGFARYTDRELRETYARIIPRNRLMSREEIERAADIWQLERQTDVGTLVSCDTQQMFYDTCRGWADFSNAQLAQFCLELLGETIVVSGDRTLAVI
jgi:hypothetical protein